MAKVTPDQAIQRLIAHRAPVRPGVPYNPPILTYDKTVGEKGLLYIVNNETAQKSLLVPSDDKFPATIGEWETTNEEMPSNMQRYIASIEEIIKKGQNSDFSENDEEQINTPLMAKAATENLPDHVDPLIKSIWGQRAPFNRNLVFNGTVNGKTLNNASCSVGCTAIAIGQVLLYWARKGYRYGCVSTSDYTSDQYNSSTKNRYKFKLKSCQAVPYFDYEHMSYGIPETSKQKKAVADFLEHIGKAMLTDYSPEGSGAYTTNITEFVRTKSRFCKGANHGSSFGKNWQLTIRRNLAKGYPIVMDGSGTKGHEFICDGYKTEADGSIVYHFNWGWYGSYDGEYFLPNDLTPGAKDYSSGGTNVIVGPASNQYLLCPDYLLGNVDGSLSVDEKDILKIYENLGNDNNGDVLDVNYDYSISDLDAEAIAKTILLDRKVENVDNTKAIKTAAVVNIKQSCREILNRLHKIQYKEKTYEQG